MVRTADIGLMRCWSGAFPGVLPAFRGGGAAGGVLMANV
jgi:hypothetical protein